MIVGVIGVGLSYSGLKRNHSTRSISVASSASAFELLTRLDTGSVAGTRSAGASTLRPPPPHSQIDPHCLLNLSTGDT